MWKRIKNTPHPQTKKAGSTHPYKMNIHRYTIDDFNNDDKESHAICIKCCYKLAMLEHWVKNSLRV